MTEIITTNQAATPPSRVFAGDDIALAYAMPVIGFLFWNWNRFESLGAGTTLFAGVLCLVTALYLRSGGFSLTGWRLLPLLVLLLSASLFTFTDQPVVQGLNCLFIALVYLIWVSMATEQPLLHRHWVPTFMFAARQALAVPFSSGRHLGGGWKAAFRNRTIGHRAVSVLGGGLIILPVLFVVGYLLAGTSIAFQTVLERIGERLSTVQFQYLWQFLIGLPVAFYLYGLIYGSRYTAAAKAEDKAASWESAPRILQPLTSGVGLGLLLGLYALYFCVQSAYLFGVFGNILPASLTYAECARKGFFELCAIAAINLAVIAAAQLATAAVAVEPDKPARMPKWLKAEMVALCGVTVVLIGIAFRKMQLYISVYGLTQLRVYTSWFMILLLFLFVVVTIRQFVDFHSVRLVAVGFAVWFLLLGFGNTDGLIARYNVDRYLSGTLPNLRISDMANLSAAAVPALIDLYRESPNPAMREEVAAVLTDSFFSSRQNAWKTSKDFRSYNRQVDRAMAMQKEYFTVSEETVGGQPPN